MTKRHWNPKEGLDANDLAVSEIRWAVAKMIFLVFNLKKI